jgi:hypothetical protein
MKHIIILLIAIPSVLSAQFLRPKFCTASGPSGIYIQQVDKDWTPVTFDCENIEVLVVSDDFENHISPGQFHNCRSIKQGNNMFSKMPVGVSGERVGSYQVTITRFDEVSNFQNVLVEWDDTGCDVIPHTLEVQFDMSKLAKKQ